MKAGAHRPPARGSAGGCRPVPQRSVRKPGRLAWHDAAGVSTEDRLVKTTTLARGWLGSRSRRWPRCPGCHITFLCGWSVQVRSQTRASLHLASPADSQVLWSVGLRGVCWGNQGVCSPVGTLLAASLGAVTVCSPECPVTGREASRVPGQLCSRSAPRARPVGLRLPPR